jgi:hypothetical protein
MKMGALLKHHGKKIMKVPCKDCLTLAICKQKIKTIRALEIDMCPLVQNYMNSDEMIRKRPMYRRARANKVRKIFEYRKLEGRK